MQESGNPIQRESAPTGFTSSSPGITTYTIRANGTYDITADGAKGGASTTGNNAGGAGAAVSEDVYLQAGAQLEIVVGGEGEPGQNGGGNGGDGPTGGMDARSHAAAGRHSARVIGRRKIKLIGSGGSLREFPTSHRVRGLYEASSQVSR
jgi:hypothetical protein